MVAIQTARQAHCVYFPEEDHLSETDLFVIQAILHQISSDVIYEHCIKDSTTIDMQFRYFNLLDRLRATEVKIRHDDNNYYSDHVNYDAVINGLAFSPDSWTRTIHREHNDQPAAFHRARAFSPLRERISAGVTALHVWTFFLRLNNRTMIMITTTWISSA